MQVACCQFDVRWEDKDANFARVRAMVDAAALAPGSLLLLPEMFATGYSMNAERVAEPPGGATFAFLSDLARGRGIFVVGGAAVAWPDGRARNEAVVVGPDGALLARYAKMHLFTYAKEQDHYAPGDAPATIDWNGCPVAPVVCYDLRFPELFRQSARGGGGGGARLFAVIANWPVAREAHWLALLRARAIENQAYVAAVNRCGRDPKVAYSGRSQIIDPKGEILADAGNGEAVIRADADLKALSEYRAHFTALDDARDDLCGVRADAATSRR